MMNGWYDGWSWWGWVAMTVGMVAFWGLVVWVILPFVRSPSAAPSAVVRSAEDLLAERFAAGIIDESEYRSRLEALRAANAPMG